MTVDLLAFGGTFQLNFPTQAVGYVLLVVYVLALTLFIVSTRRRKAYSTSQTSQYWLLFAILLISTPLASLLILIRFPTSGMDLAIDLTSETFQPTISLLASVPWILAGGLLGSWQAILVGFIGGIFKGGWVTHSVFTPFQMALAAGVVVWFMRQEYDDWAGRSLRHPAVSASVGGVIFGVLVVAEAYSYTSGDMVDRLSFALSKAGSLFTAEFVELLIAGLIAEGVRFAFSKSWHQPRWLIPGPYRRSLSSQIISIFIILGLAASIVLLYGEWMLTRSSAREQIEMQIEEAAIDTGSGVPYFIQTGRSLVQRLRIELTPVLGDQVAVQEHLSQGLMVLPFFDQILVLDNEGNEIAQLPSNAMGRDIKYSEMQTAFENALNGIPGEVILPPLEGDQGARLVFIVPVGQGEAGEFSGVIFASTDLGTNPFLLPAVNRLEQMEPGSGFLVDNFGRIILHEDATKLLLDSEIDIEQDSEVLVQRAPDGTEQLVLVYAVEGYPWYVVITKPQVVVDQLALQLASRLFAVIALIGVLFIAVIYTISRQLTRPLKHMAGAAESIAKGKLDQSVQIDGEDEIGRLAASFELMRTSLQDRLDEMDLLLAVSQRVASSLELEDVLPPILDGVRDLTNADMVRLTIAPLNEMDPIEAYQAGKDPGSWSNLDGQILILCRDRGQFILENPARAKAVLSITELTRTIEALMAVPILNEDQYVGALWLGHQRPHAFTPDEISLVSIVASQLGVAVVNARLYKLAEEERMRLMAVLEASPNAVIVTDQEGRISLTNPAANVVLSGNPEETLGKLASEVITVIEITELINRTDEESQTREITLDDGRILFAMATPVDESKVGSGGKVCSMWDITHYKKLDMLKSEFVSTVSHDLRMPLTLMKGYVRMLSVVGVMNDQQREYVHKILESTDQMAHLVDNLLDLGRIEAGLGLKIDEFEINAIITDVVDNYRPQALTKQIVLVVELEEGMEPIMADSTLLRQALANLLDNAIQFSEANDEIIIRASQYDGIQAISVEDTGMGIAPMDQARLFEKFYHVRSGEEDQQYGSGLGLAIVKSIVDQHGGRLFIESRLGVGSTFTIEIPIKAEISDPEEVRGNLYS